MALSNEELGILHRLETQRMAQSDPDVLNDRYYEGQQRLEHIGLAVPPELRRFEMIPNWCRTVVDTISNRQRLRTFYLPDEQQASSLLREGWEYNNLDSESKIMQKEKLILGRGFVSVMSNPESPSDPIIQIEDPRELAVEVSPVFRRIENAARFYNGFQSQIYAWRATHATLYRPHVTVHVERGKDGWQEVTRDPHGLGRVPIVMFLNRRRLGRWTGVSEMADVIPFTDAGARTLTNLQLATETHAVPPRYALGIDKSDFVDKAGKPIPAWEAYYNSFMATAKEGAKVGQLTGTSLDNFHKSVDHYAQQVAGVTGLPVRYFGQNTANPPSEGSIVADEARLIENVESKNTEDADGWGWVMGLWLRFKTGEWVEGSRIKAEYHNPATPTQAQTADAYTKLYSNGQGPISRESVWDALGWSDGQKDRERKRLQEENREAFGLLENQIVGVE